MSPGPERKKKQPSELPDAVARFGLWYPAASYSLAHADNDGSRTTWRNQIEALFPKHCYATDLLDVNGSWTTGGDGTATLLLSEFACFDQINLAPPVNVVATPYSADPFFLTIQHSLVDSTDVEIKVWTWDANGAAAPEVSFDWRCRVAYTPQVQ